MNDDDEWYDEEPPLTVGSGHGLDLPETPRFKSVSPAAHKAMQIGRHMQDRGPLGFHRPPVRCR